MSEIPCPLREREMGVSHERQILEVADRELNASLIHVADRRGTPPGREDFQIHEVWGVQRRVLREPGPREVAVAAVIGQGDGEDGSVYDDQRRSRSARICREADARLRRPLDLPPARARTSSIVGFSASSLIIASRYSCIDLPAEAARRLSAL